MAKKISKVRLDPFFTEEVMESIKLAIIKSMDEFQKEQAEKKKVDNRKNVDNRKKKI